MSRTLKRWSAASIALAQHLTQTQHWSPLLDDLDLFMLGITQRNVPLGGSDTIGIPAESTGDVDLLNWTPLEIDNTNSQISNFSDLNGGVLVRRLRYLVRVSNAAISVTPKALYGPTITSLLSVVGLSGAAACSATAADYTGTNSYQLITMTIPPGLNIVKCQATISGTVAVGYQVWARAFYDCYIQS